jgi:hypothetical protein
LKGKLMGVCDNIKKAIDLWISHGIKPGSCTELLLRGDYDRAFLHANPLLKPHWEDHIKYIETLPDECRGENVDTWTGKES